MKHEIKDPLMRAYLSEDMYGYVKKAKPVLVKGNCWHSAVIVVASIIGVAIICLFSSCGLKPCRAEGITYSDEQIANAIYLAEGGAKTRHPYGILTKYKTTTPRQACINTIRHAKKDWSGKGDFISFLQKRYAPLGVANDPTGLNRNWQKNVCYYLARAK